MLIDKAHFRGSAFLIIIFERGQKETILENVDESKIISMSIGLIGFFFSGLSLYLFLSAILSTESGYFAHYQNN